MSTQVCSETRVPIPLGPPKRLWRDYPLRASPGVHGAPGISRAKPGHPGLAKKKKCDKRQERAARLKRRWRPRSPSRSAQTRSPRTHMSSATSFVKTVAPIEAFTACNLSSLSIFVRPELHLSLFESKRRWEIGAVGAPIPALTALSRLPTASGVAGDLNWGNDDRESSLVAPPTLCYQIDHDLTFLFIFLIFTKS
ncbi:hypothetical protein CRG98_029640 [Punica granatum]|uniref:Uncharacterized protein n=1 Tax=Punica granatum TaxID=22663 RepID=A0A2I0J2P4_PUNGR|nr:hypothetical protein CRG98_029640 [Punica granatum]